jgi:D-alanyl-D-alanine carboxypeptidase (penicillin-binding protein 5/6)
LVDVRYDTILYEKAAHTTLFPASITKVMTALLVVEAIERGDLEQSKVLAVTDSSLADITADSSTAHLQAGEEMTVLDLLYCLMLSSANDAANVLGEGVSGDLTAFIELMNTRAEELGMNDTHYDNPHGLHRVSHYTTAYDVYLVTKEALRHPLFEKVVSTKAYTVPATNLSEERSFHNTNALLTSRTYPGYTYSPVIGVKTGSTPEAGFCLVSAAEQNGRTLIAVVLGAKNPRDENKKVQRLQFSESKRLLQHGFNDFTGETLVNPESLMREIPVDLGKGVSYVVGQPAQSVTALLPRPYDAENLVVDVTFDNERLRAPVSKNQVVGTVSVTYKGTFYGSCNLVAAADIERSALKAAGLAVKTVLTSPLLWIGVLILLLVIVLRYLRALRRVPRRHQAPGGNPPNPGGKRKL